jgi:Uri superfamily endonuclease
MKNVTGTYLLILYSNYLGELNIGSLGILHLQPGYYFYTGSAFGPGGLRARLSHHLAPAAKPHWHIDYLRKEVELNAIVYTCSPEKLEHKMAEYLGSLPDLSVPLPRFGASDCRCPAHLFYTPSTGEISTLISVLSSETESFSAMKFISLLLLEKNGRLQQALAGGCN